MSHQPKLYVHCGFHKTGSTALQGALRTCQEPLQQAGFLYPFTGTGDRPDEEHQDPHKHAHHNIAHEADRHWLFEQQDGTLSELKREIHYSGYGKHVILSSELFETMLGLPERFAVMKDFADQIGRPLVLIIYLRNQIYYAQSLYYELLNYSIKKDYSAYAGEIFDTGGVRIRGLTHYFDYEKIVNVWKNVPGVALVVRNYHSLSGGSAVSDFAELLGLGNCLRSRQGAEKLNVRGNNFPTLDLFFRGRVGRNPSLYEGERIKFLSQKTARMTASEALQKRFIERFQASNLRLCNLMGTDAAGLDMKDAPQPQSKVTLEQFFSFETHCAILTGKVPETTFSPHTVQNTSWMQGVEAVESNITPSDIARYWTAEAGRHYRWRTRQLKDALPFFRISSAR